MRHIRRGGSFFAHYLQQPHHWRCGSVSEVLEKPAIFLLLTLSRKGSPLCSSLSNFLGERLVRRKHKLAETVVGGRGSNCEQSLNLFTFWLEGMEEKRKADCLCIPALFGFLSCAEFTVSGRLRQSPKTEVTQPGQEVT